MPKRAEDSLTRYEVDAFLLLASGHRVVILDHETGGGQTRQLADALGMVEDPDGSAIIHEVDFSEPFEEVKAPVAAIAVDLMDSLTTRERSAGRRIIDGLLHA
ncbi:hypothetical protein GCM10023063_07510 [Arthrobacter methylotrophus]|uniref:Uncharacterized protein n=1 Tax=Arthrobacter methylotrophus TaxID=121291 RepID=A0ABV5UXZ9_9MICC